jgi:hypothetical protein
VKYYASSSLRRVWVMTTLRGDALIVGSCHQAITCPSGVSESVGELVIAIDMSGSIGSRELSQFLGEVKGICDNVHPEKVRLLYWDTQVCADESYAMHELDTLTESTKPAGGGGTIVTCVPEYLTKHGIKPQAVVVRLMATLVVSGDNGVRLCCGASWINKRAEPDVGKAVHVEY